MNDMPRIETTTGKHVYGENYFRGYGALRELLGETDYWSLMSLAVDGDVLDDEKCGYIDAIAVSLLVPDPKTWLFKIPRLVSSYGHAMSGLAAGQLCMRGALIGTMVTPRTLNFFLEVSERVGEQYEDPAVMDAVLDELIDEGVFLHGYGVPLRKVDERALWLERWYDEHGRSDSRAWTTYKNLKRAVSDARGLNPNIGGVQAPIWIEVGVSPEQATYLSNAVVLINTLCNAYDGERNHRELFRKFPDSTLEYNGRESRKSPRARAVESH